MDSMVRDQTSSCRRSATCQTDRETHGQTDIHGQTDRPIGYASVNVHPSLSIMSITVNDCMSPFLSLRYVLYVPFVGQINADTDGLIRWQQLYTRADIIRPPLTK